MNFNGMGLACPLQQDLKQTHEDPDRSYPLVYAARDVLASGSIPAGVSSVGVAGPASVYYRWAYDRCRIILSPLPCRNIIFSIP